MHHPDLPVPGTATDLYLAAIHDDLHAIRAALETTPAPAAEGGTVVVTEPKPAPKGRRSTTR